MGRPPKRKAAEVESTSKEVFSNTDSAGSAKKTKKNQVLPTATSSRPRRVSYHKSPSSEPPISNEAANDSVILPIKRGRGRPKKETPKIVAPVAKPVGKTKVAERDVAPEVPKNHSISQVKPKTKPTSTKPPHVQRTNKKAKAKTAHLETAEGGIDGDDDELSYWLMKAEPESRIENGYDVKFSIDDLKAAETPEPWDGMTYLHCECLCFYLSRNRWNSPRFLLTMTDKISGVRNPVGESIMQSNPSPVPLSGPDY